MKQSVLKSDARDLFYQYMPYSLARHVLPLVSRTPYVPEIVEREVIFIHVPKAAGTSVKTTLYGRTKMGHRRIAEFYSHNPDMAKRFFKFSFVRNPWSRLFSAYSFLTQGNGTNRRDKDFAATYLSMGFETFVTALEHPAFRREVLSYDHFRPQSYWINLPGKDAHAMDFLGRFERLDEDMREIAERLSLDIGPPKRTRASAHGDYRDAYSQKTRRVVEDIYAGDIAAFGYEF